MVTILKQAFGIKEAPAVTLEVQAKNTQFKTTLPDQELSYNDWLIYIYSLRNGKVIRRKKVK